MSRTAARPFAPLPALVVVAGLAGATALACAPAGEGSGEDAAATSAEGAAMDDEARDGDWIALFDGSDLSAWRGYRRQDVPAGWQVRDGLLVYDPSAGDGGDLVTRDTFGDFELGLDWRVEPGGNSGIFYRADEDADAIWHHAPEMQVLDDEAHADGASGLTSAGAAYGLYPASEDVVNAAGEWNHVRVVARGPRVEHWLNGTKIVEYEVGSEDWDRRVADSKFSAYPRFGEATAGRIGLQDHGDTVWFRDIRIRRLEPENGGEDG